ncbi:acyl-CoA dehydrogenase family protein [Acrocarpospora catenulata]|uniref:acyl-CoA dehydrogenase family protein n=1 Tax=Acrocarpospora catenulata TaxID=2836182 RepID=UPI001BDAC799|nr:acyl-CoA dehydrogenase family protein [Acrocarpospora catenulata]
MDFTYSADQSDLAALCRDVFESEYPPEPALAEETHSAKLHAALAQAGILGLAFEESVGGSGGSLFDLGIAFREAGRAPAPTTFAGTVFAGLLVDRLGSAEQRASFLAPLCAGERLATVAFAEPSTDGDPSLLRTAATRAGDGWTLTGVKDFVPDASSADTIVVAAVADTGLAFFLVPAHAPGVSIVRRQTFGHDRQDEITLDGVSVPADAHLAGASLDAYLACRDAMVALQCMEMLGGAERVLEMSAEYVRTRHQFGRPIGSFQAVQHHIADMAIEVAAGAAAAHRALWLVAGGRPARAEVAIAKTWLSRAFVAVTLHAHQVHGGMGYVREAPLHLFSQRAKTLELQLGTRRAHLEAIAGTLW